MKNDLVSWTYNNREVTYPGFTLSFPSPLCLLSALSGLSAPSSFVIADFSLGGAVRGPATYSKAMRHHPAVGLSLVPSASGPLCSNSPLLA